MSTNISKVDNYVRHCTNSDCSETAAKLHGADNSKTLCGLELTERWWVESAELYTDNDINCLVCRVELDKLNK